MVTVIGEKKAFLQGSQSASSDFVKLPELETDGTAEKIAGRIQKEFGQVQRGLQKIESVGSFEQPKANDTRVWF